MWGLRGLWALWFAVAVVAGNEAGAQVVLDGTTGPAGTLAGPDFVIDAVQGTIKGDNLFHSFEAFNVLTDQSATFTGPGGLTNVIARVTGGDPSTIDGLLRSEVSGADFWFINPSGVMFGADATIDVPGSFHVGTADHIRFDDGALFSARDPDASTLTVAAPEAFGFLGQPTGALTLVGSSLAVDVGEFEFGDDDTLSLVGGDITLVNSTLTAPGGTINLIAAGSAGEFEPASGRVSMSAWSDIRIDLSIVESTGDGAGTIRLRGGLIEAVETQFNAWNIGNTDSTGGVFVTADVLNLNDVEILAIADDFGDAGVISITANNILIDGGFITNFTVGSCFNDDNCADGGAISITAGDLQITGFASIDSSTISDSDAGTISIIADNVRIEDSSVTTFAFEGNGDAGAISIIADNFLIENSFVSSETGGDGDAGTISITADSVLVEESFISTDTFGGFGTFGRSGSAGSISITADELRITNGGTITSGTDAPGNAGSVTVNVGTLLISGGGGPGFTGISTSSSASTGLAGDINVTASQVILTGGGSIATTSESTDGGNITLNVTDLLLLDDGAITTSVAGLSGDGGNITIDPTFVVLRDGRIQANAVGGKGGNVSITTEFLFADASSVIEATSELGISGTVSLSSPASDVTGSLVAVQGSFFDAGSALKGTCGTRSGSQGSSLARATRGAFPVDPGRPMLAGYSDLGLSPTADATRGGPIRTAAILEPSPASPGCGSPHVATAG